MRRKRGKRQIDGNKRAEEKAKKVPKPNHDCRVRTTRVSGETQRKKDLKKRAQAKTTKMTSLKNKLVGNCWM